MSEQQSHRGPFPWRAVVGALSELAGLLLLALVLWLLWPPLPLALLGLVLLYLPNRR